MQFLDGRLIVSPSDLTGFLECEHLTQQELAAARGEIARPERDDPVLDMLSRRGVEHERRYLEGLRAKGLKIVEFGFPRGTTADLIEAHMDTVGQMKLGADIIYQGTFFDGRWRCHPDFLVRIERSSKLGDYSYEVADAKLARKAKAAAVLQCCVYSEQVAAIQGIDPDHLTLILGDDTREELRFKDYGAYYRSVKRRFEETVLAPAVQTYPDPVDHCRICRWIDVCEMRRRQDDHLCLVAGMRRDQTRRLHLAGIPTMAALAPSPSEPVQGINEVALDRLRRQAKLQVERKEADALTYEVLAPLGEHLGFQAMPEPTPADLFFDMEGDPFVGENGLEYLFRITEMVEGTTRPHAFWAHDTEAEKKAFEAVMDFLI